MAAGSLTPDNQLWRDWAPGDQLWHDWTPDDQLWRDWTPEDQLWRDLTASDQLWRSAVTWLDSWRSAVTWLGSGRSAVTWLDTGRSAVTWLDSWRSAVTVITAVNILSDAIFSTALSYLHSIVRKYHRACPDWVHKIAGDFNQACLKTTSKSFQTRNSPQSLAYVLQIR